MVKKSIFLVENNLVKWALIMYFLYFGHPIGWDETDRSYYPDRQSCIEAKQNFDIDNPNPSRIQVRCQRIP